MVLKKEVRIVMFSNGKTLSELFLLVSAFCFVVPCIKIYFWCEPETWATFYAFLPSYTFNSLLVLPSYKCAKREVLLKLILKSTCFFRCSVFLKVIMMLHFCLDPGPKKGKVEQEKSDLLKTPEESQPSQQVMMSSFLS